MNVLPRILNTLMPLALIMLAMGMLLGAQAFFGGAPQGPVGQSLVDYRWLLIVDVVLGSLLLLAWVIFKPKP